MTNVADVGFMPLAMSLAEKAVGRTPPCLDAVLADKALLSNVT